MSRVVAPSWQELQRQSIGLDCYLWVMRYARGGEHLKVRWHGPDAQALLWRAILEGKWKNYREGLPSVSDRPPRLSQSKVTPIDVEDQASEDYPDRFLLWTHYKRSHVSLGYHPYLQDDRYVELLTRCLGFSTEMLLDVLECGPGGSAAHGPRQTILLKAIITGLAALSFSPTELDFYLLYHRDSLLRAFRRRKKIINGSLNMAALVARFEGEIERMGQQARRLATQARIHWQEGTLPPWGGRFAAWSQALRALADYVNPICRDRAHHIDPFAESPMFPPLFKVFHGLANQIGLDALNEAFAYHLLISLTAPEDLRQRPVLLRPNL